MSKNIGTLITSSIRPNDSNDPIASAYASEIKGGVHSVVDLFGRNSIIFQRRDWGMLCYLSVEDLTYQLSYNYSSDNILDNGNWKLFESGGGGNNGEWIDSVYSIKTVEPLSPDNGDRYLVGLKPSDVITGSIWGTYSPGYVATWNDEDSVWDLTTPTNGMSTRVDNDDNSIYKYEGNFNSGTWYKERINQVVISLNATSVDNVTYVGTTSDDINVEYSTDMIFMTTFLQENNDGPVSININELGAVVIKKSTSKGLLELAKGDVVPDIIYTLAFDGVNFQLTQPYSEVSPGHKYYIEPDDYIVIPEYYQYWIYGDLTIDGILVNNGQVIVANGDVVLNSGTFSNYGDLILISFETGTLAFTNSETISLDLDVVDNIVTADVIDGSLLPEKLSSINSATAGYVLSNDGTDFEWIEAGSEGGSNFIITDYNTGDTFSNISNIVFRGDGSSVTEVEGDVVVWIPAPNYVDNFDPIMFSGYEQRYVMTPDTNGYTTSSIDGYYGVGGWNSTELKNVTNDNTITLFQDVEFGIYNMNTSLTLNIYNFDGSLLHTMVYNITTNGTITTSGVTLSVTNLQIDNDRFKASATGSIDLNVLFPNGGRFSYEVIHNNVIDTYTYTSEDLFYDKQFINDPSIGDVEFDELQATVYYSGVAFYNMGSTFDFSVNDINYLNYITIPATKQLDVDFVNMPITYNYPGHSDGSTTAGDLIQGWSSSYSIGNLTYSNIVTTNSTNVYIPDFVSSSTNNLNNINSYVIANLYDYNVAASATSSNLKMLFDTHENPLVDNDTNDLTSELGRLQASNPIQSFSSSSVLSDDELQYIFGRVIFPQYDFSSFYPIINDGGANDVDYSGLTGSNKSLTIYTGIGSSVTTESVDFNGYRWFVSAYGKDASYSQSFGNGIFEFICNFTEEDLHYNVNTSQAGLGNLVILLGVDSSGVSLSPDKFLFISDLPSNHPGRYNSSSYNLDLNSMISFNFGEGLSSIKKVWLYIGYKDSIKGKELILNSIQLL